MTPEIGSAPRVRRVRTIATKLVALWLGASAVLVSALAAIAYASAAAGLAELGEAALAADALVVVNAVDDWNQSRLEDCVALARTPALARLLGRTAGNSDLREAQDVLDSFASAAPTIESIAALDSEGCFAVETNREDRGKTKSVKFRDYFQAAWNGTPFVSGVAVSVITGRQAIFHSAPVRAPGGRVVGVVRSRESLGPIHGVVEAARDRIGEGAAGVLLDEYGLVIAATVDPGWVLRPVVPLADADRARLVERKQWGTGTPPAPLGDADLGAVIGVARKTPFLWRRSGVEHRALAQPLGRTRWTYVAALPVERFERGAGALLRRITVAAACGFVLVGLAGAAFARRLVAPVRALTLEATRVVAEGDFSPREIPAGADDEVGALAQALFQLLATLREVLGTVRRTATSVDAAAAVVTLSVETQSETLSRQSSALHEAQIMAHEIREASARAAERARAVIEQADRADEVGRTGEQALARTVAALNEIRARAQEVGAKVIELGERARQIGTIADDVKGLADQSTILALNATIEAAHAGEQGTGFAVVAQEIRFLADQSIAATARVREILRDVSSAIGTTVSLSQRGAERIEVGLAELGASGESLRNLTAMTQDQSAAVRQLASAIDQQDSGTAETHRALGEQTRLMAESLERVQASNEAAGELRRAARDLAALLARYRT